MAVTVTQQPTTPNAAYTKLIYVVSGSGTTSNPQYSYVLDIYPTGSSDRISRLLTQPNPAGVGVFEISTILQSQLQYDNYWTITGSLSASGSVRAFDIKVGEQYGTSISSSVTVYPNLTTVTTEVFTGIVNPNDGSYNFTWNPRQDTGGLPNTWDQAIAFSTFHLRNDESVPSNVPLSEYASIGPNDYQTLSFPDIDQFFPYVSAIYDVEIDTYDENLTPMATTAFSASSDNFMTIGVGPQNMIDRGGVYATQFTADWKYYIVSVNETIAGTGPFTGYYFFKKQVPCNNEVTRFAFINKYGFYDYYNVYNPTRKVTDVQRNTFSKTNVDYSGIASIYDISNRGETQYNTQYTDSYEITTDYLDKFISNWLTEMLESPFVFIQQNGDFVPIVITNSTYTANTNQNRQKLFQYTIQYKYANQRYSR